MTYYRVGEKLADKRRIRVTSVGKRVQSGEFVNNELYTEKELAHKNFVVPASMFEKVEVNRNNTYLFFGCRFEDGRGYND